MGDLRFQKPYGATATWKCSTFNKSSSTAPSRLLPHALAYATKPEIGVIEALTDVSAMVQALWMHSLAKFRSCLVAGIVRPMRQGSSTGPARLRAE